MGTDTGKRSGEPPKDQGPLASRASFVLGALAGIVTWILTGEVVVGIGAIALLALAVPSIYETGWPTLYTDPTSMLQWTVGASVVVCTVYLGLFQLAQSGGVDYRIGTVVSFAITWLLGLLVAPFAAFDPGETG